MSYGDYVEQLTYLLFLKMVDEQSRPPCLPARGLPVRSACRQAVLVLKSPGSTQGARGKVESVGGHRCHDRRDLVSFGAQADT